MAKDIDKDLKYIGVTEWRNNEITGKGINIWNIEMNSGHGANSGQVVKDVAPNVNLFFGRIGSSMDSETIKYLSVTDPLTGETDNSKDCIENFIVRHNIKVITSSQAGSVCKEWTEYMKSLQKKYNLIILNCAFNDGDDDDHETIDCRFPVEVAMIIGALGYNNGNPKRMDYSSVGKELDFAQLILWWSGTSSATPCQAGMVTMILERYGDMCQQEMYQYLKMISKDLQAVGHDVYTGWGHPILPSWNSKYITMTTKSNEYKVNGEVKLMDTKPVNLDGNVMCPIRPIAEALNFDVQATFNTDKTIHITITKDDLKIVLDTGSNIMFVNGKKVYLNQAPYIDENNRTLVPVRAITESFGASVDWVQSEALVQILVK